MYRREAEKCKMEEILRLVLKIVMWVLLIGFGCNLVMQTISYAFYKNAKQMEGLQYTPTPLHYNEALSGYGFKLDTPSDHIILYFGGSKDIAYNAVGRYGGKFNMPFLAADYYGSQGSQGKMNLKTMQQTATDLYDWASVAYPGRKIVVIGHSYGAGIATYLASVRVCERLILLAAYRDLADLYNKITPIFWGPAKIFISNNIDLKSYAKSVNCDTTIIGSHADKTLSAALQKKVQPHFSEAELKIFDDVNHEDYLNNPEVIGFIESKLRAVGGCVIPISC